MPKQLIKSTCKFKLDNRPIEFEVVTNLKEKGYDLTNVLMAWLKVTKLYTAEDFAEYVNARTHLTECFCLTLEQYETKRAQGLS